MQHYQPHVLYRMFDVDDQLLYVGITVNVTNRMQAHQQEKLWWAAIATINLTHYPDRDSVLAAERAAIRDESPRYNLTCPRPDPVTAAPRNRPDVGESPIMKSLRAAVAERIRAEEELQMAILEAMDAGENQSEIAAVIGKSREYLRKLRKRVREND